MIVVLERLEMKFRLEALFLASFTFRNHHDKKSFRISRKSRISWLLTAKKKLINIFIITWHHLMFR